jgi:uncharacterized 2Fe-2S/4Fe-4S cluster protein (DUF4445 family)
MPELKVHDGGNIYSFQVEKNKMLFDALRNHGFSVYSPCGGKGTCGKCEVLVKEMGMVTSCLFKIQGSLEVILPEQSMAQVLSSQHSLTLDLPLNPGASVALSDNPHGIAIDLGTTTLVFYLVNLKTGSLIETLTLLNPQSVFGADVISRIQYVSTAPSALMELHTSICSAINSQLCLFIRFLNISTNDIVKIAVAGNNTMLHLLMGEDPSSMGQAPYVPKFTRIQKQTGLGLRLYCHPRAEITLLPSVSAYVGADIVAGISSIRPMEKYRRYLFMDLGTNGELALVTPETIWCCATAAGPAFEGANISCGMGSVKGAITHYSSQGFQTIGDDKPIGLCGSGLVDVVAYMVEYGLADSSGFIENEFEIVNRDQSGTNKAITITQADIREVQLAKSAIATGINILLKHANLGFNDIDALFLAGGFGNYLDVESAMKIGLISGQMKNKVVLLGNTAGTGAILSLRSKIFETEIINVILQRTRHVELSEDDDFAVEFAMNMSF